MGRAGHAPAQESPRGWADPGGQQRRRNSAPQGHGSAGEGPEDQTDPRDGAALP